MKKKFICPTCNKEGTIIEKYDAYACTHCKLWLEEQCSDSNCNFCSERPKQPQ